MLTPEQINDNWKKFLSLCSKTGDRAELLKKMVTAIEDRLVVCPASSKKNYHSAYPGGLVDHSLRVFKNALKLRSAFGWEENIRLESLIIASLFHDLGKVGDECADYYLPQKEEWKREKYGEEYVTNQQLQYMTVPDRGLWLFDHFGVKLSKDEWLAIKLNDGQYVQENQSYKLKEPLLAIVVSTADLYATLQEKGSIPE